VTNRARERQLAKLAARRQADRQAQQRRRSLIVGGIAGVLVVGLAIVGAMNVFSKDTTKASGSPAASPSGSPAVAPCSTKVPKTAGGQKPTFSKPPPMTIDPSKTYLATMQTSCGTVVMELNPEVAPIGVNNFVFLAEQGFYDGLTFHRIVAGFAIQGGDPAGDGSGGPGYQFKNEISKKVSFDSPGVLAYANAGVDTNGSQFFITLAPTPNLDPTPESSYTIFGSVTKGMDVVQQIGAQPAVDSKGTGEVSTPVTPIYIDSITITEK
jgi:cyclophilin family peptidyl-prolyl cis-trans isomerase